MLVGALTLAMTAGGPRLARADDDSSQEQAQVDAGGVIDTTEGKAPASEVETPQTGPDEPTADATPWGVFLAILSGAVALAVVALRLPGINAWLAARGWKRHKPWIAAVLGGIGAVVALAISGVTDPSTLVNAAVAGVVAGLGATGAHQAVVRR